MSESWFRPVAVVGIVLAGFIAYANSFRNDFVWDDASSVLLNKHVQDPAEFFQLFREDQHPFGRGQGNFYRPLVAASFMLDFRLSYDPSAQSAGTGIPKVGTFVFHLTNTLWHVAAAVLLFALLTRLGAPDLVRLAVPMLYVVHPLHTEAVTYISGRADSMSATFILAALWFALYEGATGKRIGACLLSALCFVGGLLSKESATIFPFLLLFFILAMPTVCQTATNCVEGTDRKKAYITVCQTATNCARLVPFGVSLVILAIYAYLRMTVLRFADAASAPPTTLGHRLIETCQAFALYIKLIFVPTGLHMERSLEGVSGWTALAGAALLLSCVGLLIEAFLHNRRRMALGIGWFLLTWLPISGLFPLNAPMAEHWLYVPLAGFLWALAEAVVDLARNPRARALAVGIAWAWCVLLIALTVARNNDWRDNETVFRDTLAKNPRSVRVHYNLAVTYEDILKNLPGARRHYEDVIALYKAQKKAAGREALYDEEIEAHNSLGKICLQQGNYAASAEHYRTILSIGADEKYAPLLASAAFGLGKCFLATGDVQRAGELFKRAVQFDPALKGEIERFAASLPATM